MYRPVSICLKGKSALNPAHTVSSYRKCHKAIFVLNAALCLSMRLNSFGRDALAGYILSGCKPCVAGFCSLYAEKYPHLERTEFPSSFKGQLSDQVETTSSNDIAWRFILVP